jgi:hypothetical protein
MNFGGQFQWLENQASTADGPSTQTPLTWSPNDTDTITTTGTPGSPSYAYTTNGGYSYASFIIGAVNSSSATLQPFSVVGGRFRPAAFYFQDDWKVTPKLTLNLGMRWDYLPPYHEALARYSFLNPNIANPITGNLGALQFAGNYGGAGVSCGCATPVNTYWKNVGPRLGFNYAVDDKTVFRGGWGVLYAHAGGTGGAGGAGTGTGQAGFNSTTSFTAGVAGPTAAPAFYLNNNTAFSATNSNFGGPGVTLTPISAPGANSPTLGTGYYVCSGQGYAPCNGNNGSFSGTGTGIAYADPYVSGRAPEFEFYNFGVQREITQNLTISLNYSGSQSHFISGAGGIRGLYAGQLDPKYLALGANLSKAATATNVAAAQTATGITLNVPYPGYTAAAATTSSVTTASGSSATIAHMLTWMPQYSGTTDTWGIDVANANYNAFQLSLAQRAFKGLTFNVNYTYSHNIDDAGTQRSGYDIPAAFIADGQFHPKNRIDRSLSINSQPQNLSVFGVYESPFGKGKIGGDHFIVRALLGGWQMSHIFQYSSGLPLAIVGSCTSTQNVGQGTCMPDYNPNYHGGQAGARQNGGWGQGVTAATLGTIQYLAGGGLKDVAGGGLGSTTASPVPCATSTGPYCDSGNYMIGDLPRIAPYGLRGPSQYRLTSALRRTFDITERAKFIFGVDCQNVTNTVTFGNNSANGQIGVNVDSATFGTLNFASGDPRAFQFSGRFTF